MAEIRNYNELRAAASGRTRRCVWCSSWMAKPSSVLIRTLVCCIVPLKNWRKQDLSIQSLPYMDRLDYVSMMSNEHAYCLAIEKAAAVAGAGTRPVHPRHVRRSDAPAKPPAVARLPRARRRRDDSVPVLLP